MTVYSKEEELITGLIERLGPEECGIFASFLLNNAEDIKTYLKRRVLDRFGDFTK